MCAINFIQLLFILMTSALIFFGCLVNLFETHLPVIITKSFRYGKFACTKDSKIVNKLEVPKSWFKHFYVVGVIFSSFTLYLVLKTYIFEYEPTKWVVSVLDYCYGCERIASVSKSHALVAVILVMLQAFRRFYDTHFVSVFGTKSTMNLTHYFIGIIYYPAVILAILSEAPKFASTTTDRQLFGLKFLDYLAILLFLWSWIHQHTTSVILANLRKNMKGDIVTNSHKIPYGDWFEYLSSPHSTAEILMYTALTWLLANNRTWWTVYFWVISNQVESILLSHWWYKSTFKNFPKNRRALIPFIY